MKWIDAFLCFRQQRVVVNGVKIQASYTLEGGLTKKRQEVSRSDKKRHEVSRSVKRLFVLLF